jgi:hypothetical protein
LSNAEGGDLIMTWVESSEHAEQKILVPIPRKDVRPELAKDLSADKVRHPLGRDKTIYSLMIAVIDVESVG